MWKSKVNESRDNNQSNNRNSYYTEYILFGNLQIAHDHVIPSQFSVLFLCGLVVADSINDWHES